MSVDVLRLLALHSEIGYVDRLDRALPDEPEAVSENEQRYLTSVAQRDQAQRDREAWLNARATLFDVLLLLDVPSFVAIAGDVRAMRRIVERIDRRLR